MALTTVSQPVGLQHSTNGFCKFYTGTAEQILAAGLARADQFPGVNGRTKFTATYYDGKPSAKGGQHPYDEKYLNIKRVSKARFDVAIGMSADEKDRWCEEQDAILARENREASRRKSKANTDLKLFFLNTSKEDYKAKWIRLFPSLLEASLYGLQPSDEHGYSFNVKTLNELRGHIAGMCAALERGDVVFDRQKHDELEKSVKADQALNEPMRPLLRLVHASGTPERRAI